MSVNDKHYSKIIYDPERGQIIDAETGEVLEENLPLYKDVRIYEPEDVLKKRTYRLSDNVHDLGLFSEIKVHPFSKFSYRFRKLAILHRKLRTHRQQRLVKILMMIHDICGKLGIPKNIRDQAIVLAKKITNTYQFFRETEKQMNLSLEDRILTLIYVVMRNNDVPITLNELFKKYYGIERKDKVIMANRLVHILIKNKIISKLKYISPISYLDKYISQLGLEEYRDIAYRLLLQIQNDGIVQGRSPLAVVGAILYIIGRIAKNLRYKDICNVVGVTEVTIRNIIKVIDRYYDIHVEMEVIK